ncbi:MAG: NAD(P)/FAD-dependent oxidoreductase [Eubacteriales bacterium]
MRYVVIGNSTAAVGCIEGIRSVDREGTITLLSSEKHHTYGRPLISYMLEGKTDPEHMKYRPDSFYSDNSVDARLGVSAVAIDPVEKTVKCSDSSLLPYDRLLVATGSRPIIPKFEGLDTVEKKFTFMTLDDANALADALTPQSRVLVVGAGLIGLKCAEGIYRRCGKITVVDMADRILPSVLTCDASEIVQRYLESVTGAEFILGDSVKSFNKNVALTASGKELAFDVLVIAVGVLPNISLVSDIGGEVGRGIVVDERSRTSVPDIFAAGDCTECYDISADKRRVLAILPNAYMQGFTAGVNMAGGDSKFDNAIPMNAAGFCGLHIITAGDYSGEADVIRAEGDDYKAMYIRDNRLVGYIMIGNVANAGIYTSLIREKTPLDTLDFAMIREKPQLMAFAKSVRTAKLNANFR